MAAATDRPDRFVGMHFFNPAVLMRLVEIIRGRDTSDEAFKAVCDLQVMSIKVLSLYFILCQRLFSAPTPGRETCAS